MTFTIQPTKKGAFIVRNRMGNELAKFDTAAAAAAHVAALEEAEREQRQASAARNAEQAEFDSAVADLNALQLRWQNWRNWFYGELTHEDRRLASFRNHLDNLPDDSSPAYRHHERSLSADQTAQHEARRLYERAVAVDREIKDARRAKNQGELERLLSEAAEPIIAAMDDYFPHIARPEEYKPIPAKKPGAKPNTSLYLSDEHRSWLQDQGGIQPTIRRLIDNAMRSA